MFSWCHILCYCLLPHPVAYVFVVLLFVLFVDSYCIPLADEING